MFVKNALYSYGLSVDGNTQNSYNGNTVNGHIIANINQSTNPDAIITWDGNGNILFGDKNVNALVPNAKVNIKGDLNQITNIFTSNHSAAYGYNTLLSVNQPQAKALAVQNFGANPAGDENFVVYGNGYTEIKVQSPSTMPQPYGATNPRAFAIRDMANNKDLFVITSAGKTYAREVEISLATTFPDYVFANNYKLKPLKEVEAFIKQYKHLPNFEKGEHYEKNGINVTDIIVKQQQTIEELMLYNIELEKRLKALEEKAK